jgi:hypothetical protein
MSQIFKHEVVGLFETSVGIYEVCAVAEAEYDDASSRLVVCLDAYLRLRNILAEEIHSQEPWLPKKNQVGYSVSHHEVSSTVDEVFCYWVKKVRNSIPATHAAAA